MRQGPIIMQSMCGACNGEGRVIRSPCLTCSGKGHQQKRVKENIKIPKGVNSGINLRMHKKGHFSPTGPSGDLMLKINVKPHPYFKRDGFDILTDAYISVTDAILGGEVTVKTLTADVKLKVDPGTQDSTKKKLVGLGIQKLPPN
jgi:molecular chaperone DnaJ